MRILLLVVIALIAYGSFFPFAYFPHTPRLADLVQLFLEWPRRVFIVDAVGNLLLFLPLGLCIPAMASRRALWPAWVACCIAFAWGLQYLQFWFPWRYPTGSDAWFNTAGILLGLAFGAGLQSLVRAHAARLAAASPLWPIASVLLLLWLAYRWFPLVPSPDLANLRRALVPLLDRPAWNSTRVLHDTAAWLLWFLLLRYSPWHKVSAWAAGLTAAAVLVVEPIFWFNVITLSNVAGLLLALLLRPWFTQGPQAVPRVGLVLLASIVVSGLTPWPHVEVPRDFLWMPFAGLLNGNMLGNTASLIEKSYLYGGTILLLGQWGMRLPAAGLLLGCGLWGIEWVQRWSPGRVPELTDPVLALLLGIIFQAALSARPQAAAGRPHRPG